MVSLAFRALSQLKYENDCIFFGIIQWNTELKSNKSPQYLRAWLVTCLGSVLPEHERADGPSLSIEKKKTGQ
jgi:hypothetical protein